MTKSQLITILAKKGHLTKKAATEAVEVIFDEISRSIKKGEKIVVSGFGTFLRSKVKDKQVVPFGREEKRQTIKGHGVVLFKAGKPLKKAVW